MTGAPCWARHCRASLVGAAGCALGAGGRPAGERVVDPGGSVWREEWPNTGDQETLAFILTLARSAGPYIKVSVSLCLL